MEGYTMVKKKLICFDLDNTLILSDRTHVRAYNYALKKMRYPLWKHTKLVKLFGRPKFEIAKILTSGKSPEEAYSLLKLHHEYLKKKSYKYAKKVEGVDDALKRLKKKYTLVVVSNTRHRDIDYLLKGSRLDSGHFRLIIGSDEVKHSKPYPDEIIKVEKLLHHKPEYMIGDSIYDMMAARHAKIKAIGVLTGHYSKNSLSDYSPVAVLKSVADLPKFLGV